MRLLVGDKNIPLLGVVVYDDLSQIYTTIEVVSSVFIDKIDVILKADKTLKCKIVRSVFENNMYRYTLVSEGTWNVINMNCTAFTGSADVNKLLSSIGVKNFIRTQSDTTNWVVPQTKLRVYLKYLNNYASIQSGGAPRFYVDVDGRVSCIDLKKIYTSASPVKLTGEVISDIASFDWVIKNPGKVDVISYSKDGTKTTKVDIGPGYGVLKVNDTTGFSTDLMIQRLKNEYFVNYYSARRLNVTNPSAKNLELGTLVQIGDLDEKFMIFSRTVTVPVSDEVPVVKLVLCAPCQR